MVHTSREECDWPCGKCTAEINKCFCEYVMPHVLSRLLGHSLSVRHHHASHTTLRIPHRIHILRVRPLTGSLLLTCSLAFLLSFRRLCRFRRNILPPHSSLAAALTKSTLKAGKDRCLLLASLGEYIRLSEVPWDLEVDVIHGVQQRVKAVAHSDLRFAPKIRTRHLV